MRFICVLLEMRNAILIIILILIVILILIIIILNIIHIRSRNWTSLQGPFSLRRNLFRIRCRGNVFG